MDTRDNSLNSQFDFTEDISETKEIQQLSESVYYLSLQQPAKLVCSEYYCSQVWVECAATEVSLF